MEPPAICRPRLRKCSMNWTNSLVMAERIVLSVGLVEILRNRDLETGGESGIRTHGRVSPTHAFQACSFNHSDISPYRINNLRTRQRLDVADCDKSQMFRGHYGLFQYSAPSLLP